LSLTPALCRSDGSIRRNIISVLCRNESDDGFFACVAKSANQRRFEFDAPDALLSPSVQCGERYTPISGKGRSGLRELNQRFGFNVNHKKIS
jgi:hypothetical protein